MYKLGYNVVGFHALTYMYVLYYFDKLKNLYCLEALANMYQYIYCGYVCHTLCFVLFWYTNRGHVFTPFEVILVHFRKLYWYIVVFIHCNGSVLIHWLFSIVLILWDVVLIHESSLLIPRPLFCIHTLLYCMGSHLYWYTIIFCWYTVVLYWYTMLLY